MKSVMPIPHQNEIWMKWKGDTMVFTLCPDVPAADIRVKWVGNKDVTRLWEKGGGIWAIHNPASMGHDVASNDFVIILNDMLEQLLDMQFRKEILYKDD